MEFSIRHIAILAGVAVSCFVFSCLLMVILYFKKKKERKELVTYAIDLDCEQILEFLDRCIVLIKAWSVKNKYITMSHQPKKEQERNFCKF